MIDANDIDQELSRRGLDETGQPLLSSNLQKSFSLNSIANSAPVNFVLGAGDALQNTMADIGNLIPGVNIPLAKTGQGTAYSVGRGVGDIASFMGLGELGGAALGASKAAPYIGDLAKALGSEGYGASSARNILGSTGYGALTNPQDRTKGAEEGAILSSALNAIPGAFKLGSKVYSGIKDQMNSSQSLADQIQDALSGGSSMEENRKKMASDIKESYEKKYQDAKSMYDPIFERAGDQNIYDYLKPKTGYGTLTSKGIPDKSSFSSLTDEDINNFSGKANSLYKNFVNNPNLQNAHDLQSQLGIDTRIFQKAKDKGSLSPELQKQYDSYLNARDYLKNDIDNFIENVHPDLSGQYKNATDNYAKEVVPYLVNNDIKAMAKGKLTNPDNLTSIFKSPQKDELKVINDLGPDAQRRIIYDQLGKVTNKKAENLNKSFDKLDEQGLSSYVTPEIQQLSDQLKNSFSQSDRAKAAGQALGGMALGGAIGHVPGAVVGMGLAPLLGHFYSKLTIPPAVNAAASATKQTVKNLAPSLRDALLATILPQGQNQ